MGSGKVLLGRKGDGLGDQTLPKHVRAKKGLVIRLDKMVEGRADSAHARRVFGAKKLQHKDH